MRRSKNIGHACQAQDIEAYVIKLNLLYEWVVVFIILLAFCIYLFGFGINKRVIDLKYV